MSEEISRGTYGRKWGLIFGLVSAIIFTVSGAARLNLAFASTFISWAVVISVFVLGLKEFREDNEGFMSFGQGFGLAMMIALIGGVVRGIVSYVYLLVDTEYLPWIQEQQAASNPFGTPPEGQEMPPWMDFFQTPEFIIIVGFLGAIFAGLIFGGIVSAILKNEAEEF